MCVCVLFVVISKQSQISLAKGFLKCYVIFWISNVICTISLYTNTADYKLCLYLYIHYCMSLNKWTKLPKVSVGVKDSWLLIFLTERLHYLTNSTQLTWSVEGFFNTFCVITHNSPTQHFWVSMLLYCLFYTKSFINKKIASTTTIHLI